MERGSSWAEGGSTERAVTFLFIRIWDHRARKSGKIPRRTGVPEITDTLVYQRIHYVEPFGTAESDSSSEPFQSRSKHDLWSS